MLGACWWSMARSALLRMAFSDIAIAKLEFSLASSVAHTGDGRALHDFEDGPDHPIHVRIRQLG